MLAVVVVVPPTLGERRVERLGVGAPLRDVGHGGVDLPSDGHDGLSGEMRVRRHVDRHVGIEGRAIQQLLECAPLAEATVGGGGRMKRVRCA